MSSFEISGLLGISLLLRNGDIGSVELKGGLLFVQNL